MQPPEPVMVQPVVRLTERGIDWGTLPGPADEVGYGMHPFRGDDCFRTAVATAIQAPIEQVPDGFVSLHWAAGEDPLEVALRVWRRMIRWAAARGLELMIHRDVPVLRERWIGVVRDQALFDRLVAEAKADPDRLIAGAKANPEKFRGLARRTPEEIVEAAEAAPEKLGNWIGGLPHALVMSYGRIVFDPSCTFRPPPGSVVDRWNLSDVVFGISFDRMEE